MPVYEYACKACGQHLEVSQSFTDDPLTVCPACGGQLRKVFNSIGISFKGTGFYRTDSRMAARKESEKAKDKESKEPKEPKGSKEKATAGAGDQSAKSESGSSSDKAASAKPDAKSA